MNIIYFGSSTSSLSLIPLQALLDSEHRVQMIVTDDDGKLGHHRLPVFEHARHSLASLAFQYGVPLISLNSGWSACRERLQACAVDVMLVSCFSRCLPETICALPKRACINLHPSLLPAYRGPDPVFWQFREGHENFGVSLHQVLPELDKGAVYRQRQVSMPDGVSYSAACQRLAEAGREAMLDLLAQMDAEVGPAIPQDETRASYQSFPEEKDFVLSSDWTARRMYNFISAMAARRTYFPFIMDGHTWRITRAYAYQCRQKKPLQIDEQRITVPCADGSVEAAFLLQ